MIENIVIREAVTEEERSLFWERLRAYFCRDIFPDPEDEDDPRNCHAHIMLTMRPLDPNQPDGWAKNKDRTWNTPETLEGWRASWAEAQNTALARAARRAATRAHVRRKRVRRGGAACRENA